MNKMKQKHEQLEKEIKTLKSYIRLNIKEVEQKPNETMYECNTCEFKTQNYNDLTNHKKTKHEIKNNKPTPQLTFINTEEPKVINNPFSWAKIVTKNPKKKDPRPSMTESMNKCIKKTIG